MVGLAAAVAVTVASTVGVAVGEAGVGVGGEPPQATARRTTAMAASVSSCFFISASLIYVFAGMTGWYGLSRAIIVGDLPCNNGHAAYLGDIFRWHESTGRCLNMPSNG
jgi:hypothetical protein